MNFKKKTLPLLLTPDSVIICCAAQPAPLLPHLLSLPPKWAHVQLILCNQSAGSLGVTLSSLSHSSLLPLFCQTLWHWSDDLTAAAAAAGCDCSATKAGVKQLCCCSCCCISGKKVDYFFLHLLSVFLRQCLLLLKKNRINALKTLESENHSTLTK